MSAYIQVMAVGRSMPTLLRVDSIVQVDWVQRGEGMTSWSYLTLAHAAADMGLTIDEPPPAFAARLRRVEGGEPDGS